MPKLLRHSQRIARMVPTVLILYDASNNRGP